MAFRLFLALLVTCLLSACASPKRPTTVPERFAGHWTLGATFSEFVTLDGRAFYIFADDMPQTAYKFLTAQHPHSDSTSESGDSVSAYFEVVGRLLPSRDGTPGSTPSYKRLHVEQVVRMEKPHTDYLASFKH